MNIRDKQRIAKAILEDNNIKVWQKDIDKVVICPIYMISDDGGKFPHRELYKIIMKDGIMYEVTRETVDADGKFSKGSAKYATKEVRRYEL